MNHHGIIKYTRVDHLTPEQLNSLYSLVSDTDFDYSRQ